MKTFLSSGGCGDVIYQMAVMRELGGGILYLKRFNKHNKAVDQYEALKALLEAQEYVFEVREYPQTDFFRYSDDSRPDVDLDSFRGLSWADISKRNMLKTLFEVHGIIKPVPETWIDVDGMFTDREYAIINKTPRHMDYSVDWHSIDKHVRHKKYADGCLFVGLDAEYEDYINNFSFMAQAICTDLLDVAMYVKSATHIYCNQSAVLTLAQAMNKPYSLVCRPKTKNCIFNRKNETIINA